MILPPGSVAMTIDTEGKAIMVVTKEDELQMLVEDPFSNSPLVVKFGKGQDAFDELINNLKRVAIFSGD